MFERFTDRARRVIALARDESHMWGHGDVGAGHLLVALAEEGEGVAYHALLARGLEAQTLRLDLVRRVPPDGDDEMAAALATIGIDLDRVRSAIEDTFGAGVLDRSGQVMFSPEAKERLEGALKEALALGHNYIGTEHLLLGLLGHGSVADTMIEDHDLTPGTLRDDTLRLLRSFGAIMPTPTWQTYTRLLDGVARLPEPERMTAHDVVRRVVYPIQGALLGALGKEVQPALAALDASLRAARGELAPLGVLDFLDLVPELLESDGGRRLVANRVQLTHALTSAMDSDSEELVRAYRLGREVAAIAVAGWAEVWRRHHDTTPAELAELLASAARSQLEVMTG